MNRDEQLRFIRAKCIEANPEKEWEVGDTRNWPVPARLAEVLRALNSTQHSVSIDELGRFYADGKAAPFYELRKDDLTEQSDECVAFLADLLK